MNCASHAVARHAVLESSIADLQNVQAWLEAGQQRRVDRRGWWKGEMELLEEDVRRHPALVDVRCRWYGVIPVPE